ncbi:hypothetical protein NEB90_001776 [Campylobacter jejuni]|uniref:hypothetical protein n=1 Tax=Campylobacter jejuni TaxID=197 RepID=UPI0025814584|nr:hypothetical protein [Campylobacter jejuni]EJH5436223.1 hypothetical protein [Campylobacter jejuni]BEJ76128.1 hypothetical protein B10331_17820 [Campylobacter jejuni]GML29127.1 hypothetical protein B10834_16750 [Campylobacter jejuni]GMM12775.1 hypothetical protein I12585_16750 [Campylobacter jejuni]HDV6361354.1 hypothetical protein [Campylobacter jejuni]
MKKINIDNIKNYYEKNKTKSIITIIGIFFVLLFIFLIVTNPNKKTNEFEAKSIETPTQAQNVEKNSTYEFKEPAKEIQNQNPPKLNNPFVLEDKKDLNITNKNVSKKEEEIPDISDTSFEAMKQEEAIKKIIKTQKPKDMVVYLKEIQKDITLLDKTFKYDLKEYQIGDKFLDWYLIEDINNNFIRFRDENLDYSYNLRFLGDKNE